MCTFSLHFIFLWCFSHCKFQFWQNGKYNSKDPKIEDSKICLETNVDYDFLSAVFVTLNRRNHCRNYLLLLNFFIIRLAFLCCVCAVCCLLPIAVWRCLLMLLNAPKWFSWICNRMYRHYTNIESVQTKTHSIKRWAMNTKSTKRWMALWEQSKLFAPSHIEMGIVILRVMKFN